MCEGSAVCQDSLRKMKVFNSIMGFLPSALSALENQTDENPTLYTESVIRNILDLISNAIDANKQNQEFILANFKIYDIINMVINQNEYLHLAGKGCLVLSHLLWTNPKSQQMFATNEIVERLIFLVDFNQLINESDPDASIESLQEISFFALLAVINHTKDNKAVASMFGEFNALMTIIK